MNPEQNSQNQESGLDKMKQEVEVKLKNAFDNPLPVEKFEELEIQIREQEDKFFKEGQKSPEDIAKDEEIKNKILAHGAVVKNLPEYAIMLEMAAEKHNLGSEWVRDTLEHENAHANISEVLDFDNIGYALFYLAGEDGEIVSLQPLHIHEAKNDWSPTEVISKNIEALKAPEVYGNRLSNSDIDDIDKYVKKGEERGEQERVQIEEVRKRLGI